MKEFDEEAALDPSQCTYRCVVLPDGEVSGLPEPAEGSQCTYRCVVLPDSGPET